MDQPGPSRRSNRPSLIRRPRPDIQPDLPIRTVPVVFSVISDWSRFQIKPTCLFRNYSRLPLPEGFEARQDAVGRTYYLDHRTESTDWDRPLATIPINEIHGQRKRTLSMLPEATNYAHRHRYLDEIIFMWGFSVRVQADRVYWPACIDNWRSANVEVAPIDGDFNPSQSASTTIVIEVIKVLTGDDFPMLPEGSEFPPYRSTDLPAYSRSFRPNIQSHRSFVRLEISDTRFKLSPTCLFPRFANQSLPDRFEARFDPSGRQYYLDHAQGTTSWDRPAVDIPSTLTSHLRGLARFIEPFKGEYFWDGDHWSDYSLRMCIQNDTIFLGGIDDRSEYNENRRSFVEGVSPDELASMNATDLVKRATSNLQRMIEQLSGSPLLPASGILPPYEHRELPSYAITEQGQRFRELYPNLSDLTTDPEDDDFADDASWLSAGTASAGERGESPNAPLLELVAADNTSDDDEEPDETPSQRRRRMNREAAARRRARETPEQRAARLERERQARQRRGHHQVRVQVQVDVDDVQEDIGEVENPNSDDDDSEHDDAESDISESDSARNRRLRRDQAALRRELEDPEDHAQRLEDRRDAYAYDQQYLEEMRELAQELHGEDLAMDAEARNEHEEALAEICRGLPMHKLALEYNPEINMQEIIPRAQRIGSLEKVCRFCQARKFKHESDGFCCGGTTKTRVPLPVEPPPEVFVWYTRDRPEHRSFMKNIRRYNTRFAMTSFGCNRPLRGEWDPAFKIQGQVYHRIGALLPVEQPAAFLQIYFLGEDEQEDRRMEIEGQIQDNRQIDQIDRVTLRFFQNFLMNNNLLINQFRTALERAPQEVERLVLRTDRLPVGEHPRRFNAPTGNEVSILIVAEGDAAADSREVVLQRRGDMSLQRINEMHPSYDALQYPLIFWRGNETHTYRSVNLLDTEGQPIANKFVTTMDYYSYILQVRVNPTDNFIFRCGALLNQFAVDMYAKIEAERLRFFRCNQDQIRAADYVHLLDAVQEDGDDGRVGRMILPSTFIGGPRNMNGYMQDAMAMVRVFGRPSLFITMTCNPSWVENTREYFLGQSFTDRYDIISRVFKQKVRLLLRVINHEEALGPTNAYVYSIEWQKRGLPHIHLLVFLRETLRPEQIDDVISAEIPDQHADPELYQLVTRHMIHGPCGILNPNSVCMQVPQGRRAGVRSCEKHFPKEFVTETMTDRDSYPNYRRRSPADGGRVFILNKDGNEIEVDNGWVVPYCPFLLKMFQTHMNVEYCYSVKAIKYLFKYINKGADMSMFQTERRNANVAGADDIARRDEITSYETARYLSASEAFWKIFSFSIHGNEPAILHLEIHLENFQRVYFREGEEAAAAARGPRRTTLTWFFELCLRSPAETRDLLYVNVPEHYTYEASRGFQPRQRGRQIGRLYTVHPNSGECYFLRLLLIHRPGPRGFLDIKTVDGRVHDSFRDACQALNLLENDAHLEDAMTEACADRMPSVCRNLFAAILIHSAPADPKALWLKFRVRLSEDIARDYERRGRQVSQEQIFNEYLIRLEDLTIAMAGKRFGEGPEDIPLPVPDRGRFNRGNSEIERECNYDVEQLRAYCAEKMPLLTNEQREIFNELVSSIELGDGGLFFLDAPGGTGKTFLINLLLAHVRSEAKIILACASSGIAATLMDGGRTAHTTFNIPIKHRNIDNPLCNISRGTNKAELLEVTSAIVWDEATMSNRADVEAVDRTLRDIRQVDQPFGNLVVLFSGDFRQCLPVIPKSTPAFQIYSCLKHSYLWRQIRKVRLTRNMRVHINNEPGAGAFGALLLRIGGGHEITNELGEIQVHARLCVPLRAPEDLIEAVFPNIRQNIMNRDWIRERAILAPLNANVDELNVRIQNLLPKDQNTRVYYSVDTCTNPDAAAYFPVEVLNGLHISNFPAHRIELRAGSPIILTRNLHPPTLCNGTRLSVIDPRPNVIIAEVLTGPARGSQECIPRIKLFSDDDFIVKFSRRQFPVRLAYAMTINKAQGQTLKVAGLDLFETNCFSHGQLYVACSRVGRPGNLFILTKHGRTKNVVYQQVFRD